MLIKMTCWIKLIEKIKIIEQGNHIQVRLSMQRSFEQRIFKCANKSKIATRSSTYMRTHIHTQTHAMYLHTHTKYTQFFSTFIDPLNKSRNLNIWATCHNNKTSSSISSLHAACQIHTYRTERAQRGGGQVSQAVQKVVESTADEQVANQSEDADDGKRKPQRPFRHDLQKWRVEKHEFQRTKRVAKEQNLITLNHYKRMLSAWSISCIFTKFVNVQKAMQLQKASWDWSSVGANKRIRVLDQCGGEAFSVGQGQAARRSLDCSRDAESAYWQRQ